MTISQRIFELLSKQNKKQKDLANKVCISTSAISDWKKKGTNPSAENISAIAEFLEVSCDYLLTGKDDGTNRQSINLNELHLATDEERLLKMYRLLTDIEKGEFLSDLKHQTSGRETKSKENVG